MLRSGSQKFVRAHCEFLPGVQCSRVEAFANIFVNLGLRNPSELTIRSAVAVLILMCVPIEEAVAMDMEAKRATVVELKKADQKHREVQGACWSDHL